MKNSLLFRCCCFATILFLTGLRVHAQINSWTNSAGGNWEDSYWSLGTLPATNQSILLTNEGIKTLTIGSNTVQNFAGTLNLYSLTISSPPGSSNTLRLNNSGTASPLTVRSIAVASNSAMTMLSSALQLDGPNGIGMQVGGEFDQTDSLVNGQQVNVGYNGPGVYNLISGSIGVSNLWVGGSDGVFNQTGGTNNVSIVHLDPGGTYNFSDGNFNATLYFSDSSTFHQIGGIIDEPLVFYQGTYIQSGGTNSAPLFVGGGYDSMANYVLSNGCSFLPGLNLGTFGTFHQFGGTAIVTNTFSLAPDAIDYDPRAPHDGFTPGGAYWLSGGTLMTAGMMIDYLYTQDGGTNLVAGDIQVANSEPVVFAGLELEGGLLTADNITMSYGGLYQTGGCLKVNNLTAHGFGPGTVGADSYPDIDYLGGQLIVSNINVEGDNFAISTTNLVQTGALNLVSGILLPGPGRYTFGPLMVNFYNSSGAGGASVIRLGTNVNCQIHFADSSGLSWGNILEIQNWSGSIYGGGSQQIFFGNNAAALTSNQLSQIMFSGPAGPPPSSLPAGFYPARILATGEIVPNTGASLPMKMTIACAPTNSAMQLSLGGDIGQSYDIEVSTDLVNWTWWTNQFNSNGTICIFDSATNSRQKFYRAHVAP